MDLAGLIEMLSNLRGVSGYEGDVAAHVSELFQTYCDAVHTDALGSVIAVKRSRRPDAGKVMIEAHMDEIGMMVTDIDEHGFLFFTNIGGIDARILLANEVVVHGVRDIPGIIGAKPPHILSAEERKETVPLDKLYIDTGYPKTEVEKLVRIGDTVTFQNKTLRLKNDGISTKTQDDRTSVAILAEILKELRNTDLPFDLYTVAAVQEEVGLRGSGCAAYQIDPDFAIAIDVCHASTPDASKNTFPAGGGTVISRGPNIHPGLFSAITQALDEHHIAYAVDVDGGDTGTDAWAIQVARSGIPTALFSLPLKYMHTPVETVALSDVKATAHGIAVFLNSLERTGDALCL